MPASVVLVNTSSTSPSLRKVAILMPCGTLLFQPTKIPCKAMGSRLPRRTVGCSNFIANARKPQGGHELGLSLSWQQVTFSLSREGTSFQHDWCHHVVLSRHCSLAVVVDFVCMLHCIRPQTHRCIRLVQETSNTTFSSTNTPLRQDCSRSDQRLRSWCEGLCVLSASRRLRITVETPNRPLISNWKSAIASAQQSRCVCSSTP